MRVADEDAIHAVRTARAEPGRVRPGVHALPDRFADRRAALLTRPGALVVDARWYGPDAYCTMPYCTMPCCTMSACTARHRVRHARPRRPHPAWGARTTVAVLRVPAGGHVPVSPCHTGVRLTREDGRLASFVFVASYANSLLENGRSLTTRFPAKHHAESALTSATWGLERAFPPNAPSLPLLEKGTFAVEIQQERTPRMPRGRATDRAPVTQPPAPHGSSSPRPSPHSLAARSSCSSPHKPRGTSCGPTSSTGPARPAAPTGTTTSATASQQGFQ